MSDRDLIARLAAALRVQLDGVDLYSDLLAEADAHQGKPGGGAMSGDFRAVLAELVAIIERHCIAGIHDFNVRYLAAAMARARALMVEAQPQPVEPTDEELRLLSDDFASYGNDCRGLFDDDPVEFARAVLARWGRPAPEPVSVAERLPTAADCDAHERCWWLEEGSDDDAPTHWLPYWALPVPQEQAP